MTKIIDGKLIAQNLRDDLKKEISQLKEKHNKVPGLAVVQVGDVAASSVYVKAKTKSAIEVGIAVIDHHLEDKTTQEELISLVHKLNNQENVNGILVQLPLPNHMNEQTILDSIDPSKDADGFHPLNVGKLSISSKNNENLLIPCTPYGCLIMLKGLNIDSKRVRLITRLACYEGLKKIGESFPDLRIYASCVDPTLTGEGDIIPGIGNPTLRLNTIIT